MDARAAVPVAEPPLARPDPRAGVRIWNLAVFGTVVLAFAVLVWHRRWMSDDGLIVLRTVRHLLAGEGPVFNAGERVEASTSTLWTYLVAVIGLVPGVPLNRSAMLLGLVCAVAGLALALDAASRLHGPGPRAMLPFGALVVAALPPFWDFGTSGLETGLINGWLALVWWLLVRRLEAHRRGGPGRAWPVALALGLAPLVRPDLALFGLLAAVGLVVLEARLGWRRIAGLAAVAAALPVSYEVFRAGYYGLLVPASALAKEASEPRWQQGVYYLADLVQPYRLWFPLGVLAVGSLAVLVGRRPPGGSRIAGVVVAAVPVVAGLLLAVYILRVGGDFMHGRMLLPALFCLVLPVAAVPLGRWTVLPVAAVLGWALVSTVGFRPDYDGHGPHGIANERLYYVIMLGVRNPVTNEDYRTHPVVPEGAAALAAEPRPALALAGTRDGELGWYTFPKPAGDERDTIAWLNLGVTGASLPLDTLVLDGVGLANPLAAHSTRVSDGRIGHDKELPLAWFLADAGIRATAPGVRAVAGPDDVRAARAALSCERTVELLDSVRAPLTFGRFWLNLRGAWERTEYRYPGEPTLAARCASP